MTSILLSLSLLGGLNDAEAAELIVQVTAARTFAVALGREPSTLPPWDTLGVGVLVPLSSGWAYYNEIGVAPGESELKPAFQVVSGPTYRLSKLFVLGGSALYKLSPTYDGGSPTHIAGVALTPVIPNEWGSISFPTGASYNITAGVPVIATNVKVAILLP